MTFNENARIDTSKVQRRRGGRTAAVGGGSLLVVIGLAVASQIFGVNLMPFAGLFGGDGGGTTSSEVVPLENCETGADANANDECRMAAASDSLDTFWVGQFESGYRAPGVILYSGTTSSACGTASASIGPFYCPSDESIYLDTDFFASLGGYGADNGPLAQMYVLAHEWGHHISNLTGSLSSVGNDTGPASGSVRLELQADCYAGAWIRDASTTTDASGVPFMKPVTQAQLNNAMGAAAAVGDDNIQQRAGQQINPDGFTHGTSEQRQRWLQVGYQNGATSCDTFGVSASSL